MLQNVSETKLEGMEDTMTEMTTCSVGVGLRVIGMGSWLSKWVLPRLILTTALPSIPPSQKSWLQSSRQTDHQTFLGHMYTVAVAE